ncbi:MAG: four helix bundle protein [Candidatus Doudnabacteria bacterium]|nr:four helix bundle protein [Candidatus Doudnabacteria bacterium]
MVIEKFEDIISWQKSRDLAIYVYQVFKDNRDFSFRDQIRSAVVSMSNNIAEGFERKGNKEFRKFLYIAKGSCAEVRSMAYIALELGYITKDQFEHIYRATVEISKLISGLIKTL